MDTLSKGPWAFPPIHIAEPNLDLSGIRVSCKFLSKAVGLSGEVSATSIPRSWMCF